MKSKYHYIQYSFKTLLSTCLLFLTVSAWAETEQEQAIQAPVIELHNSLLTIMGNADSSSFQDRYNLMETTINNNFHTPLIVKVILSRHWKSLGEQTQTDFIDLFNRLTISTYVNRFDSLNEHSFKTISIEPMKKGRFMVKTELSSSNDDPVSFNYIVQNTEGQWKIISVIANGVNDLSLKRAEYASVIKNQGFDALVASLEEKISDLQPK